VRFVRPPLTLRDPSETEAQTNCRLRVLCRAREAPSRRCETDVVCAVYPQRHMAELAHISPIMKNVLVALATEQCAPVPVKVRPGLTTPNRRRSNLLRKVSKNAYRETGDLAVLGFAGALSKVWGHKTPIRKRQSRSDQLPRSKRRM
jgi:hypothetical protein